MTDQRYQVSKQHRGHEQPQYVVSFVNKELEAFDTKAEAEQFKVDHHALRRIKLIYPLACGLLEQTQTQPAKDVLNQLTQHIIELCKHIIDVGSELSEDIWYIDTYMSVSIDELIVGAYWYFLDYHKTEQDREALALLTEIFQPGMTTQDDCEALELFENLHEEANK